MRLPSSPASPAEALRAGRVTRTKNSCWRSSNCDSANPTISGLYLFALAIAMYQTLTWVAGGRSTQSSASICLVTKGKVGIVRLLTAVLRILGQDSGFSTRGQPAPTRLNAGTTNESRSSVAPSARTGQRFDERSDRSATESVDVKTRFSTAGDPLPTASGHDSKIFEMELTPGRYLFNWSVEGKGGFFSITDESEINGRGRVLASANPPNPSSEEKIIRLAESGRHLLSVDANNLDWTFSLTPI